MKKKINQKPQGEWNEEDEILQNIKEREKTSPSLRSVCYPKLQIFVETRFRTNLQPAQYGAAMS